MMVLTYPLMAECGNRGIIAKVVFKWKRELSLTQSDQTRVNLPFHGYFTKHLHLYNRLLAAFSDESSFNLSWHAMNE